MSEHSWDHWHNHNQQSYMTLYGHIRHMYIFIYWYVYIIHTRTPVLLCLWASFIQENVKKLHSSELHVLLSEILIDAAVSHCIREPERIRKYPGREVGCYKPVFLKKSCPWLICDSHGDIRWWNITAYSRWCYSWQETCRLQAAVSN